MDDRSYQKCRVRNRPQPRHSGTVEGVRCGIRYDLGMELGVA